MRIIAGEFRGRKLLGPESDSTRPITDRAKQSLFDILAPLLPDAVVYDCFAGTGSMGLESLSRGAAYAVFFEKDRSALARLRTNIETLDVAGRCHVIGGDIFRAFSPGGTLLKGLERADLLFLDPPYRYLHENSEALQRMVEQLLVSEHLASDATIVFRHDASDTLELPRVRRYDQRDYGGMRIELLRPER